MSIEFEIFEGKSLSSLFEDIYDNSKTNKEQLTVLVKEVAGFIKDGDMAVQLIPMIKELWKVPVYHMNILLGVIVQINVIVIVTIYLKYLQ